MPKPRGRLSRLALTTLGSLTLVVLIGLARWLMLAPTEETEPMSYTGTADAEVDADRFTVTVDEIEFAHDLQGAATFDEGGESFAADGVWLVVRTTVTATTEPIHLSDPVLLESGDGHTYAAVTEVQPGLNPQLNPGIPSEQFHAFEVSEDRLSEPTLRLTAGELDTRLSAEAVVDLQLNDAELADRIAAAVDEAVIEPENLGEEVDESDA